MPSSSDRQTVLEVHLHRTYKVADNRLFHSGKQEDASYLSQEFAHMLDTNISTLESGLNPRSRLYVADKGIREQAKEAVKQWEDASAESMKKNKVDRIWSAGDCCAEAGACLFQVVRSVEARHFCEIGEWLHNKAAAVWQEQEEMKKRGRTSDEAMEISDDEL